jgi:hypothetical protein
MAFLGDIGKAFSNPVRIITAVATGGLSEIKTQVSAARSLVKLSGVDQLFAHQQQQGYAHDVSLSGLPPQYAYNPYGGYGGQYAWDSSMQSQGYLTLPPTLAYQSPAWPGMSSGQPLTWDSFPALPNT